METKGSSEIKLGRRREDERLFAFSQLSITVGEKP